jgi:hypothetical protein
MTGEALLIVDVLHETFDQLRVQFLMALDACAGRALGGVPLAGPVPDRQ